MEDSKTLAVFEIDGKERNILDFNFDFSQAIDKENQPCGIPRPGKLNVKVLSNKTDGNVQLLSWMLNCQKKKGEIRIKDTDGKILNKIVFEDAYCVNHKLTWVEMWFKEGNFNNANAPNMIEEISIAWRKMDWGGVSYENNWQ